MTSIAERTREFFRTMKEGDAMRSEEIADTLGVKGPHRGAVHSVISILTKKGYVRRDQIGRVVIVNPNIPTVKIGGFREGHKRKLEEKKAQVIEVPRSETPVVACDHTVGRKVLTLQLLVPASAMGKIRGLILDLKDKNWVDDCRLSSVADVKSEEICTYVRFRRDEA